ncbi:lysosomal-associated transmembrane protein 4B-like [Antedon mediterranea]|uniref:lysosomal-associated transmembrane protein 4B-like n=1 Tax=Antedon mediterranea TaxID=105859 RepID=UPI003AF765D4
MAYSNEPKCCCDTVSVRVGAGLIGVWNLIGQIVGIGLLLVIITFGSYEDRQPELKSIENAHDSSDYCVGLVILVVYCMITIMMLHGTLKYRSSYLLPFFCLMQFDFFVSCLTAIGVLSYYPDTDYKDSAQFPYNQEFMHWKEQLPVSNYDLDGPGFMAIAVIVFMIIMVFKGYCISCVWACYKYIAAVEFSPTGGYVTDDMEALIPKPPAYEEVVEMEKWEKPPAYEP